MVTGHVFIATSLDGYIARLDGGIDWLLERAAPAEDHGYHDFIADKDMILMGRNTYEKALEFDPWPYEVPVLVLSARLAGTPAPAHLQGKVTFTDRAPRDLMGDLARQGVRRVYVDGGQVVQSFLAEGLIADLTVTTVPVLIGAGRPLFGTLPRDLGLALVSSRSFPSGLVQSTYRVPA